jgi:hypothetical protein
MDIPFFRDSRDGRDPPNVHHIHEYVYLDLSLDVTFLLLGCYS